MANETLDIAEGLSFSGHWSPKVVTRLNDCEIKVLKLEGGFLWHGHQDTDELFLVVAGELMIQLRDGNVTLNPGQLLIVSNGVEHCPNIEGEVHALLIEPADVLNTGEAGGSMAAAYNDTLAQRRRKHLHLHRRTKLTTARAGRPLFRASARREAHPWCWCAAKTRLEGMGRSTKFGTYTDRAVRAVIMAQEESRYIHDSYIGPEHLLLGLIHTDPEAVQTALGVLPEEVRDAIAGIVPSGPPDTSALFPFTRESLDALKSAQRTAQALHFDHVGIKHLLFGVLSVHGDRLDRALLDAGVDRDSAQTRLMAALTQGPSAGQGAATGSDPPPMSG